MRYAIVSDLHANRQAWQAVLCDLAAQSVDEIICLGDIVGYGPSPVPVLERAYAYVDHFIQGNHDAAIVDPILAEKFNLGAWQVIDWTKPRLAPEAVDFLANLPSHLERPDFICAHGDLANPGEFKYVLKPEDAIPSFEATGAPLMFIGHTHRATLMVLDPDNALQELPPENFQVADGFRYLVNVGSVGQPRQSDLRSCYCIYDDRQKVVFYRHVPFDIEGYAEDMRQADLPIHRSMVADEPWKVRGLPLVREDKLFEPPVEAAEEPAPSTPDRAGFVAKTVQRWNRRKTEKQSRGDLAATTGARPRVHWGTSKGQLGADPEDGPRGSLPVKREAPKRTRANVLVIVLCLAGAAAIMGTFVRELLRITPGPSSSPGTPGAASVEPAPATPTSDAHADAANPDPPSTVSEIDSAPAAPPAAAPEVPPGEPPPPAPPVAAVEERPPAPVLPAGGIPPLAQLVELEPANVDFGTGEDPLGRALAAGSEVIDAAGFANLPEAAKFWPGGLKIVRRVGPEARSGESYKSSYQGAFAAAGKPFAGVGLWVKAPNMYHRLDYAVPAGASRFAAQLFVSDDPDGYARQENDGGAKNQQFTFYVTVDDSLLFEKSWLRVGLKPGEGEKLADLDLSLPAGGKVIQFHLQQSSWGRGNTNSEVFLHQAHFVAE